jgi:carbamoyl-phosphate synthase large subunit
VPKRDDISSVLVIGSGPIVIGQACEFDYSGVQACRVLRSEGIRVILANSNPATIMTDPEFADATYIEPLEPEILEKIIAKERPDVLLPTLGGQTALNLAIALSESGVLKRYGVEMIGANEQSIKTAEDRDLFKIAMKEIGVSTPRSALAHSYEEALVIADEIGFPVMLRPSFILGGAGTGICRDKTSFSEMVRAGLRASPIQQVLIEESIEGWKEFELELMRDAADNCVVVCSIENFDPMGVHTGDSITVAPAQTLSDFEYQEMRDTAFRVIRRIGVETGGSNIQFAIDPKDGRMVVIEMNPRVSRSSALASKATGFPIAKIATKLALGYLLDEVQNDITRVTPASFEPTIDYVVTKVPRWVFEKFPGAVDRLGTSMQSVGEAMGVGRSFCESLQKALRSIERGREGLNADPGEIAYDRLNTVQLLEEIETPTSDRIFKLESLLRRGCRTKELSDRTGIDPWFLDQMARISKFRNRLALKANKFGAQSLSDEDLREAKRLGFSDAQISYITQIDERHIERRRRDMGLVSTYKAVDTCAAEFEAFTPYFYSTYESHSEVPASSAPKVIILGSGPNRIGQGLEFDYCCVHASFSLRDAGYETIMINCNPETVSTDYDTSTRLYVEPLTKESVNDVIHAESKTGQLLGVIVSFGGQTPLRLAGDIDPSLVLGTSPSSIDLAEDRERWNDLCARLNIPQPHGATVHSVSEAKEVVGRIGFPVLLRPSYVLGGRAMEIVYDQQQLEAAFGRLKSLKGEGSRSESGPVLVDKFLEDAIEVDVDAVRDRVGDFYIGGVMEHVEEAGVHSGDSACALPPQTLSAETLDVISEYSKALADELEVVGLINIQFAVKAGQVFVIEANPRASRTVPFVAKATAVPLAKIASLVMVGETLDSLRSKGMLRPETALTHVAVKEAVLPFNRFPEADTLLGPEMRSTGEVMGIDTSFPMAFLKSQLGAGTKLPKDGTVFLSLADRDKAKGAELGKGFQSLGYRICATQGTAEYLRANGVNVDLEVAKVSEERDVDLAADRIAEGEAEDGRVDAVRLISSGVVSLVINTPRGSGPRADGYRIRSAAQRSLVPALTTVSAAQAALMALREIRGRDLEVHSIQEFHSTLQER